MNNLIVNMAGYSSYPILERIFTELKSVPSEFINENYLTMLTKYTKNVLENIKKNSKTTEDKKALGKELTDSKLYDINIFWNIVVLPSTEVKLDFKVKDYAVKCLVNILESSMSISEQLIVKAFDSIKTNALSIIGCIKFIMNCYKDLKKNKNIKSSIKKYTSKESGLLDKIITSLLNYKEGKTFDRKYEETLKDYFDFIGFIIELNKGTLQFSQEQLDTLWKSFVTNKTSQEEANFFYRQLIKPSNKAKK